MNLRKRKNVDYTKGKSSAEPVSSGESTAKGRTKASEVKVEDLEALKQFKAKHGESKEPPTPYTKTPQKAASNKGKDGAAAISVKNKLVKEEDKKPAAAKDKKTPKKAKAKKGESKGQSSVKQPQKAATSTRRGERKKPPQEAWADKLEELRRYKTVHGHTNVPKLSDENKQLGRWVNNQRQFYRRRQQGQSTSLTDDRIKSLEGLGFVWSMAPIGENRKKALQSQWEQRLQELQDYKEIYGSCDVPVKGEHKDLGKFLMNQRYYYKMQQKGEKNSLTPQRKQDLEDLGVQWTYRDNKAGLSNEEKWEKNVEELKKFKAKFGHVNVGKTAEYMSLGQFCGNQRYFYRRRLKGESTSLTDARIKTLSDMGFVWTAKNKQAASKLAVASKRVDDSTHDVEKDQEVYLPDGSMVVYSTKEKSQKRLVLLEDSSHVLEVTTETYATKIEKSVIPPNEIEDATNNSNDKVKPSTPSDGTNVYHSKDEGTLPDGSTFVRTTEESVTKRIVALDGVTRLLETTTTTSTTKKERIRFPEESVETVEMKADGTDTLASGVQASFV